MQTEATTTESHRRSLALDEADISEISSRYRLLWLSCDYDENLERCEIPRKDGDVKKEDETGDDKEKREEMENWCVHDWLNDWMISHPGIFAA